MQEIALPSQRTEETESPVHPSCIPCAGLEQQGKQKQQDRGGEEENRELQFRHEMPEGNKDEQQDGNAGKGDDRWAGLKDRIFLDAHAKQHAQQEGRYPEKQQP